MKERLFQVTLFLRVYDVELLKKAAYEQALKEGLDQKIWREYRTVPGDDLRMLVDPGVSWPGTSIDDTEAEETTI